MIAERFIGKRGMLNPNWKGGLVNLACELCGKTFQVKKCHKDRARFCSMGCANIYQKTHPYCVGERIQRISKNCRLCGKEMFLVPSRVERTIFCSSICHFAWRSNSTKSDGNPNWRGGTSRMPYPYNWADISRKVRHRDDATCQNPHCDGSDRRMVVHHIDYNKSNVDGSNLITLCST